MKHILPLIIFAPLFGCAAQISQLDIQNAVKKQYGGPVIIDCQHLETQEKITIHSNNILEAIGTRNQTGSIVIKEGSRVRKIMEADWHCGPAMLATTRITAIEEE